MSIRDTSFDGIIDAMARAAFAASNDIHGIEPNWGRSTPEQPSGYKTEVAMWEAVARACAAVVRFDGQRDSGSHPEGENAEGG
jgi:hypothetical protein